MLLQCCYVALLDLLRMCAMLLQYFAGFVDNVLLCCYSTATLLLDLLALASPFLQRTSIIHDLLEDVVQGDTML